MELSNFLQLRKLTSWIFSSAHLAGDPSITSLNDYRPLAGVGFTDTIGFTVRMKDGAVEVIDTE
ncbi:hypothetical protein HNQ81_000914 [Desulfoprunum benzoelyticum]|uniref:Uncharacterized protein n=1 Tax=Desulfoprunum benzoelyticum TaxID=1506996 RepID=A0A840V213_9BACT|nr:hypothetical protein [Desulfoprunum benzoelyticum]